MSTYGTAIHRDDGELVGFVDDAADGSVVVRAVFGAALGTVPDRDAAADWLRTHGLACLAETWWLHGEECHLVEAAPGRLRVALGPLWAEPQEETLTTFDGLARRPGADPALPV